MKMADTEFGTLQEMLERKKEDLVRALRERDGITIEKSADQMDEIQICDGTRPGDPKRRPRFGSAASGESC